MKLASAPQLVLLDLDGTLTDSGPGIKASLRYAYTKAALPVPDEDELHTFVGPPMFESMTAHGVPRERLGEVIGYYREAFTGGGMFDNSVYPGIPEALAALRERGLRLAIATSKPEIYARPIVEHFGLEAYLDGGIDAVFGADVDGGERSSKADVIGYALESLAARPAGLPAADRIVMVGDRVHDVEGAREHGLDAVGVAWGYARPGELEAAGAVAVVETPAELVALVSA